MLIVAEGIRRRTLASNLGPPQNPTTWTTWDRVPYAPKYSQTTTRQKYIWVKFPINCRVARWPRGLGDGPWPQILDLPSLAEWLLLNNHSSLGRLGSAALVDSQSRRRTIQSDSKPTSARCAGQTRRVKTLGPWTCLSIQQPCPCHGSAAPMLLRKVLEPEVRRRTLH